MIRRFQCTFNSFLRVFTFFAFLWVLKALCCFGLLQGLGYLVVLQHNPLLDLTLHTLITVIPEIHLDPLTRFNDQTTILHPHFFSLFYSNSTCIHMLCRNSNSHTIYHLITQYNPLILRNRVICINKQTFTQDFLSRPDLLYQWPFLSCP